MRRRRLLLATAAVGATPLAGCLDRGRAALGLQPGVATLDPGETRPDLMWLFERLDVETAEAGEPVELVGVGSGDDHHWVTVAAESDEPLEASVEVRPAGGETLSEETVELSNVAYLGVRFAFRQDYEVDVSTAHHEATLEVPAERVDCNESNLAVLLATDGAVRTRAAATDMAC